MNVALVNFVPQLSTRNYMGFNHGLGHLSAIIKQRGHTTRLFPIDCYNSPTLDELADFSPSLIFVYLATNQINLFVHFLETARHKSSIPIFVGGPHATCRPREVLSKDGVTGVCIGEGEKATARILERLAKNESFLEIPNLWVKKEGAIIESQVGDYIENLDTLPFPDRSIFPYERLIRTRNMNILGFEFFCTRGCPHNCSYCINPQLRSLGCQKIPIRRRSPKNLIDEIVEVTTHYDYEGVIGFHDDIFTIKEAWLAEFAEEYSRRVGMPFWCNTHFRNLNEKTVKLLRSAGCFRVQLGVECGNEEQRRSVLNKTVSNRRIIEMTALLKKHHLKIVTNFMIGVPGETEENILESIALCKKIKPDWVLLSTYCPYPGTALYQKLVAAELLEPRFYENLTPDTYYSSHPPVVKTSLSEEQHRYYFENFVSLWKSPSDS